MSCALSLLQGMCLTHLPSKQLCSSRSSLELFLAILGADYSQSSDTQSSLHLLSSHAIDTLMCVLVDASTDTRRIFEQAHGLRIVRRVMNSHTLALQQEEQELTRSKCLEFLLFYLKPDAFEEQATQQLPATTAQSVFQLPETPKPRRRHGRSKSAITATPFYTPISTPRTHQRVLSYGSPTRHVMGARAAAQAPNPFVGPPERGQHARESHPHDPLWTPRAHPRKIQREQSPVRDLRRWEFPRKHAAGDASPAIAPMPPPEAP